ncbi:MAG: hypothetical protein J6C46_00560 [Clostridia bacterium]|nr:hypothetical protein [Clostridia bacterium]
MYNFPNKIDKHDTLELFDMVYNKEMSNNSSCFHFNVGELRNLSKQDCLYRFKQNIQQYNLIIDKLQQEDLNSRYSNCY